ncbi:MAG: uracil-DNA glycosylase family protein [Flavobacteriales bacterium]|nr:uracil-DNA glycosylase family protein [Flavobacteriales bacterium]
MKALINRVKSCTECAKELAMGPNPVFTAHPDSRIVIIGQAPGLAVHNTNIPWNDKSGDNLRKWMGISVEQFYNTRQISIIPMGFCYPGKGKTGDLPPRKECAPLWHQLLFDQLQQVELVLLVGKYAQDYYLKDRKCKNLTQTVRNFKAYLPQYFVLPHPSPRNNIWQAKNEWFKQEVLPELKFLIHQLLK